MREIISMEQIRKSYTMGHNELEVLKDIDLSIKEGEFVVFLFRGSVLTINTRYKNEAVFSGSVKKDTQEQITIYVPGAWEKIFFMRVTMAQAKSLKFVTICCCQY